MAGTMVRPCARPGSLYRWTALLLSAAGLCLGTNADAAIVSIKASHPTGARGAVLNAELFKPRGEGPFPAVVLMHGCGGWQPAVTGGLAAHTMYLLDRGYAVLNLDSFGTRGLGGGTVCESTARLVRALDYRTHDAFDALHYLRAQSFIDPHSIFLMGQSNGGSVAINAAKMTGRDRLSRGRSLLSLVRLARRHESQAHRAAHHLQRRTRRLGARIAVPAQDGGRRITEGGRVREGRALLRPADPVPALSRQVDRLRQARDRGQPRTDGRLLQCARCPLRRWRRRPC